MASLGVFSSVSEVKNTGRGPKEKHFQSEIDRSTKRSKITSLTAKQAIIIP